ncbi:MAG: T9SS type A sorting domain-containing protein [Bacteroidetes bacterium]|nr:T9SS type A sorting domain-containing protein [Bacteroidota bacterium]
MKKMIAVVLGLMLTASFVQAQVIANFEDPAAGTQGISDGNWGSYITGVSRVADPSGKSDGVLEVGVWAKDQRPTADPKDAFTISGVKSLKGKFLAYSIWIPADAPDKIGIEPFMQSGDGWKWQSASYTTETLAKEKWVTLVLDLDALVADGAELGKVQALGVQIQGWNVDGATDWTGKFYFDNISVIGAEPTWIAQFEDAAAGTQGLSDGNWGSYITGISQVADPSGKSTGVLQVGVWAKDQRPTADPKDAVTISGVKSLSGKFFNLNIWLPASTPDKIGIEPFMQTGDGWKWQSVSYSTENLAKEKWVTLQIDLDAMVADGAELSKVQALGVQIQGWNVAAETDWTGNFYIDNISVLGTETGAKWVLANFESLAVPTMGFTKVTWGPAVTAISREVVEGNGVLKTHFDFAAGTADAKGVIQKDNVAMYNADVAKRANQLSLDVFIPADFPLGGQIGIAYTGTATNGGWTEDPFQIDTAAAIAKKVIPGKWNKIYYDFDAHVANGDIKDSTKAATVYVQVFYGSAVWEPNKTYAGDILYDNLTLVGIPEPKGAVESPTLGETKVMGYAIPSYAAYEYVRLYWEDNKVGTETYNIYRSTSAITDVNAPGVKKVVGGVPHGMQTYTLREWSANGGPVTYYYAITAFDGVNETSLRPVSATGAVTVNASPAYKVQYVGDFNFQLDGLNDEFLPYEANIIRPDGAGGTRGTDWNLESMDMNFKTTFVIDDRYLYISAEVDDDNLRHDPASQAWEGDALEFYFGFYDRTPLTAEHAKNYSGENGDWRIGFNSDGNASLDGGSPRTISGVTSTVFEKFSGDGYIIEVRLDLDSLSAGKDFKLVNEMMMPLRIDGNDYDPVKGETSRGLIVQAGGVHRDPADTEPGTDEDWKRPDGWGSLMVVGAPNDVADNTAKPFEYSLSRNYPNPFNPSTTIKYSVANQGPVLVKVFDMLGREVKTLVNKVQPAGNYVIDFNANGLASGVYLLKINAGQFNKSMKMMLVK